MRIRFGRYRKTLTIAFLGAIQVAAYIIADPGELPGWVVTTAAVVNTLGVFWVRNDHPAESRRDLADRLGTRAATPEERLPRRPSRYTDFP